MAFQVIIYSNSRSLLLIFTIHTFTNYRHFPFSVQNCFYHSHLKNWWHRILQTMMTDDNMKLYLSVKSFSDCHLLQKNLDRLIVWGKSFKLSLNISKFSYSLLLVYPRIRQCFMIYICLQNGWKSLKMFFIFYVLSIISTRLLISSRFLSSLNTRGSQTCDEPQNYLTL